MNHQEAGRNTALAKMPQSFANSTISNYNVKKDARSKQKNNESRKEWADAVKLDLTKYQE
jgi:hypothetical protein